MCDFEMGFNGIIKTDSMRMMTSSPECPTYTVFIPQFQNAFTAYRQFNISVEYQLSKTNVQPSL